MLGASARSGYGCGSFANLKGSNSLDIGCGPFANFNVATVKQLGVVTNARL